MQAHPLIEFEGVHLHIGSQILNTHQFAQAVENISSTGTFATYDVGGGLGVKYTYAEEAPSVEGYLDDQTEEARRMALWRESNAASFPELWGRGPVRGGD